MQNNNTTNDMATMPDAFTDSGAVSMSTMPPGVDEELLDENTSVIDQFVTSYLNQLEMAKKQNDNFLQTATMKACTQDMDTCASKLGVEIDIPSPP